MFSISGATCICISSTFTKLDPSLRDNSYTSYTPQKLMLWLFWSVKNGMFKMSLMDRVFGYRHTIITSFTYLSVICAKELGKLFGLRRLFLSSCFVLVQSANGYSLVTISIKHIATPCISFLIPFLSRAFLNVALFTLSYFTC